MYLQNDTVSYALLTSSFRSLPLLVEIYIACMYKSCIQWQWSSNGLRTNPSNSIIQNVLGVDCPNISLVAFLLCTEFLRNAMCLNSHGLKTLAYMCTNSWNALKT